MIEGSHAELTYGGVCIDMCFYWMCFTLSKVWGCLRVDLTSNETHSRLTLLNVYFAVVKTPFPLLARLIIFVYLDRALKLLGERLAEMFTGNECWIVFYVYFVLDLWDFARVNTCTC